MSSSRSLRQLLAALPRLEITFAQDLKKFTLFLKLPIELQNRIWKLLANEVREVELYAVESGAGRRSPAIEGQRIIPSILHVSQHARKEGLRYYTKVLERNSLRHPDAPIQDEVMVDGQVLRSTILYINLSVDIFVLKAESWMRNKCVYYERERKITATNIPSSIANRGIRRLILQSPFGLEPVKYLKHMVLLAKTKWSGKALEEITVVSDIEMEHAYLILEQHFDRVGRRRNVYS